MAETDRRLGMKNRLWMPSAIGMLLFLAGCGFENRVPIEMASMSQSQPLGNEKSLDSTIRFDIGSLEITSGKSALYSYDLEYDKASYAPEVRYDVADGSKEGHFSFDLNSMHRAGLRRERQSNRLRLAFTDSIPLDLKVNAGVGDARLSLTGLKISRIDFESGVGGAKISAYEPNPIPCEFVRLKNGVGGFDATGLGNLNFKDFEFEGGVGGANLDFSGDWKQDANILIQVGVGGVTVRMPREIGVRVEAEKHFLSGLHLDGFDQRDSFYYSHNYDSAAIKVSVRVETGIGGMKITWL
jgi:hypothetical protein